MYAVKRIVAGHNRPDASLFHRISEYREIQFLQRSFIYNRISGMAQILLVIGGKMLDSRDYAIILHTLYIPAGNYGRQTRILAIIFEIPS